MVMIDEEDIKMVERLGTYAWTLKRRYLSVQAFEAFKRPKRSTA